MAYITGNVDGVPLLDGYDDTNLHPPPMAADSMEFELTLRA